MSSSVAPGMFPLEGSGAALKDIIYALYGHLEAMLFTNWHFPTSKTREYSLQRRDITAWYGIYTTILTFAFVALLPLFRSLTDRFLFKVFDKKSKGVIGWFNRFNHPKRMLRHFLYHYNTIKILAFWSIALTALSLLETHYDLSYLGKRLGRVSTVCLTTVLFLTLRPSPLPDVLYLSLIPLHKWLSRIVVLQGLLHTIIYLFYFQHKNTWAKLYKAENLYGVVALMGFVVILVTSLSPMRRWSYRIFYINHYLWTWVIVICLHFHARPGIGPYTILNGSILLFQIYYRIAHTVKTNIEVIDISPNLVLVTMPNTALSQIASSPGSHVRLAEYKPNWFRRLVLQTVPLYHPYTVASLPNDPKQKLIIRKTNFCLSESKTYLVNGSFSPMLVFIKPKLVVPTLPLYHSRASNEDSCLSGLMKLPFIHSIASTSQSTPFNMNMKISAKRVLIVIGGSAISFALPLVRVLTYNGIDCRLVWVVRDLNDAKILKFFPVLGDCIEVYVTGDYKSHISAMASVRLQGGDEFTESHLLLESGVGTYGALDINKTPMFREVEGVDSGVESDGEAFRASYDMENRDECDVSTQLSELSCITVDREAEDEDVEVDFDEDETCGFDAMRDVEGIEDGDNYGEIDFTALYSNGTTADKTSFNARSKSMGNIGAFGKTVPVVAQKKSEDVAKFQPKKATSESTVNIESWVAAESTVKHQSNKEHTVKLEPRKAAQNTMKHQPSKEVPASNPSLKPTPHKPETEINASDNNVPAINKTSTVSFAGIRDISAKYTEPDSRTTSALLRKPSSATVLLSQPIEFTSLPSSIKTYIPYGTKILRGRPKLGGYQYDWCVNNSCSGPVYNDDGDAVCCKDAKKHASENHIDTGPSSFPGVDEDEEEKKENVWVVGAGPASLVKNVHLWAQNNGFHFHEESFSI